MTTRSTPTHLRLELADRTYDAPLLTDEAPASVAALEEFLPLDSDLMHVRWSGYATWVDIDEIELPTIPRENHTAYPSVGDILLYPGYKNDQEILLSCGPTSFKSPAGDLAGNHVATIDAPRTELHELEQRTLRDGAQGIELSLVSDPE